MSAAAHIDEKSPSSNNPRDILRERHHRPAQFQAQFFARSLRADQRLNALARLVWLMTALSASASGCTMSVPHIAKQLGISDRWARRGLHRMTVLGWFNRKKTGRQINYHRTARTDFARKLRADNRLDLTVRLLWLLLDLCSAGDGSTSKSLSELGEQLNALRRNVLRAVRKLEALELITVTSGRGVTNSYRMNTALPLTEIDKDDDVVIIDQTGERVGPPHPTGADTYASALSYADYFNSQIRRGGRR